MGDDDDMVKKAVYLGRTLEWVDKSLKCAPRSKTRAFIVAGVWRAVEVFQRHFVPPGRKSTMQS